MNYTEKGYLSLQAQNCCAIIIQARYWDMADWKHKLILTEIHNKNHVFIPFKRHEE